ncbi:hypothetical protein ACIOG7_13415, partial [Streptomyces sp. NPDC087894]
HCRFSVAEQLYDSTVPEPAEEAAEAEVRDGPTAPEPVPVPAEPGPPPAWDAQVPEVPSWLGRDDLS